MVGVLAAAAGFTLRTAAAREFETSLRWIPQNAAFYRATLRGGEQVDPPDGCGSRPERTSMQAWTRCPARALLESLNVMFYLAMTCVH